MVCIRPIVLFVWKLISLIIEKRTFVKFYLNKVPLKLVQNINGDAGYLNVKIIVTKRLI